MAKRLNDTALTILTHAAGRGDRRVLPLPKLRAPSVAVQKMLNKLLADGLIEEIGATHDDETWEHTEADGNTTLIVTAAGLTSIGTTDETDVSGHKPARRPTAAKSGKGGTKLAKRTKSARTAGKARTKQEIVISMLRRANGASIAELAKATAWQPHSVRGVLTATVKNRLNLPLISEKGEDGVRRYFVAPIRTGKGKE